MLPHMQRSGRGFSPVLHPMGVSDLPADPCPTKPSPHNMNLTFPQCEHSVIILNPLSCQAHRYEDPIIAETEETNEVEIPQVAEQKPVQFHLPENKPSKTTKLQKTTPESYMSKTQPFSSLAPLGFEAGKKRGGK